jgi:hypothetical protein
MHAGDIIMGWKRSGVQIGSVDIHRFCSSLIEEVKNTWDLKAVIF